MVNTLDSYPTLKRLTVTRSSSTETDAIVQAIGQADVSRVNRADLQAKLVSPECRSTGSRIAADVVNPVSIKYL